MTTLNPEISKKIINYLKTRSDGATSSEISEKISHNRITVTKYLHVLEANQKLTSKRIAQGVFYKINKPGSKKRILVVDDEPHIVNLIKFSLPDEIYTTYEAFSGLEAMEKVFTENPDLIILDLMMPGIDGFEVCKRLKENPNTCEIPIVILSAKTQLQSKIKGVSLGAEDYITKPFDPVELEARVKRLLLNTEENGRQKLIVNQVSQIIDTNNITQTTTLTIKNIEKYSKKYGTRKTNALTKLIYRLILQQAETQRVPLLRLSNKEFMLFITEENNLSKEIKEEFKKIIPFLYNGDNTKKINSLIELEISNMSTKQAKQFIEKKYT
jgi:two-component system, OmpR family, alkaline phosphatase synthesis response regulator PhoP